jgi:predicted secreted protein
MSVLSGIAIFFIMWWVVLFAILPIGVRTADEAGDAYVEGQARSAPSKPQLWRKVFWTTCVTSLIFGLFVANLHYGWLSLDDLPGPKFSARQ